MEVVNVIEYIAKEMLQIFVANYQMKCNCEQCRSDILALTLNRIPPKYVSSQRGEAISKSLFMEEQLRMDVLKEITQAAMIVEQNPHRA